MRRMRALSLFTLGYMLMALLSPAVAALPALLVFGLASFVLVREYEPARETARRRPEHR
jgi:hypothetical protein